MTRPLYLVALAMVLAACGDSTAPDTTRTVAIQAGDGQSATVGQTVATAPTVKITNASGAAVRGVAVTFAVASGGGSLGATSATTGADGTASAASWTLGTTAGTNTVTAQVSGGSGNVTFTATGLAAAASSLTKAAGDTQSATVRQSVATAPSVRVVDAFGNSVANVAVTFSVTTGGGTITGASTTTNASGTATVGGWTLGSAVGTQTLTAAVASIASVQFSATAIEALLQPAADTTLGGGVVQVTRLVVPAGRTVTLSADAELRADSTIVIAGTLQGDCRAVKLVSARDIIVTGSVRNGCSAPVDVPPPLTIIASGGYDLRTATIVSGGDIDITNDSTLSDTDIPVAGAMQRVASLSARRADVICGVGSLTAPAARNGTDGVNGTRGADARTWTLRCRGDLSIGGTVAGSNGGHGGNGQDLTGSASATGGAGGDGGKLVVRATGIIGLGSGSVLRSGSGGEGGNAVAVAQESPNGARAPSGTAEGGRGGSPGLITVRAGVGIQVSSGATFQLGDGGEGGTATATGARGQNGTEAQAAQPGGNASATGGDGGSLDPDKLRAFGNVLGAPPVAGGAGGVGGDATATGGNGGDASAEQFKAGAAGGLISANGGGGGDALARNLQGVRFANGGRGGAATFNAGIGGAGWNGCSVTPPKAGGAGGEGGNASGGDGEGGTGAANGAAGGVTYNTVGNGGAAGGGAGPGARGGAGSNTGVTARGGVTVVGQVFTQGAAGVNCGLPPGKGAARVSMNGLPSSGLPATLGEIRANGNLVATVTSTTQEIVLDPGTYQFIGVTVQPEGFGYRVNSCAAASAARPFSAAPSTTLDGEPCGFTVLDGVITPLVLQWVAVNALVNMSFNGLPLAVLIDALWRRCDVLNPCTGPLTTIAGPGAMYLLAGVYALTFADFVRNTTTAQETYRSVPVLLATLLAGQTVALAVSWYLYRTLFRYAGGMVVKSDVFNHRTFIAMWLVATVHMVLQHAPPPAAPGANAVDTPIEITAQAPFVTVTGMLHADGSITASGSGTVAGFPNVPVTFTGSMDANGNITGDYQMGQVAAPTGLPNGPIIYTLTGTVQPPAGVPPAALRLKRQP